jgi:hypothetical protein
MAARGDCNAWEVSEWENGLPIAAGNHYILPEIGKIIKRNAANALDGVW